MQYKFHIEVNMEYLFFFGTRLCGQLEIEVGLTQAVIPGPRSGTWNPE